MMKNCYTIVKNQRDQIFSQSYYFYVIVTVMAIETIKYVLPYRNGYWERHSLFSLKHWWLTVSGLQKHLSEILQAGLYHFRMPLITKFSHWIIKSISKTYTQQIDTLFNLCCYRMLLSLVSSICKWRNKILFAGEDKC